MPGDLHSRLDSIRSRIAGACAKAGRSPGSVRLVVVTKTQPVEMIQSVIDLGVRDIGESRVQEIERKAPVLRGDFVLHMIGHLQTNKVSKVLSHVRWIQSVDSVRLLEILDEKAAALPARPDILIEVNTSGEASKSGCSPQECSDLCAQAAETNNLRFRGLMTIGPLNAPEAGVRRAFSLLRYLGESCRRPAPDPELSMGMSRDFEWAIAEGATMVRIGSLLFAKG